VMNNVPVYNIPWSVLAANARVSRIKLNYPEEKPEAETGNGELLLASSVTKSSMHSRESCM